MKVLYESNPMDSVSYAITEKWRIGPGVMYQQGKQTFFANLYFESGAENRAQGAQLTLRYLHGF